MFLKVVDTPGWFLMKCIDMRAHLHTTNTANTSGGLPTAVATHVRELAEVPKDKFCGKVHAFEELALGALMSCRLVTAENIQ